jgi:cell division protein FtsI/penicillin-binding protein 2
MSSKDFKKLAQKHQKTLLSAYKANLTLPSSSNSNSNKNNKSSSISFIDILTQNLLKFFGFLFLVFFFWLIPLKKVFSKQFNFLRGWFDVRENVIKTGFGFLFFVILFNLANLQVLGNGQFFSPKAAKQINPGVYDLIAAKRGNIYFKDLAQMRDDIPLSSNQIKFNITFDPLTLKAQIDRGVQIDEVVDVIASRTNISTKDIKEKFNQELSRQKPLSYAILEKEATEEKKQAISNLKKDKTLDKEFGFSLWISIEEINVRTYPEGKVLAQTVGYTPKFNMPQDEAKKRLGCKQAVEQNEQRQTELSSGYQVGDRGVEEKYCSILSGLNGKKITNQDLTNSEKVKNQNVVHGADVFLTIDKNIQKKAEQVLEDAVRANTSPQGSPKDGCAMVMESATGKILALASYPYFDPNQYSEYYNNNPNSFRNNCTSNDYEVGSVMKPITVAAALTSNESGYSEGGKTSGVNYDFSFVDYDKMGKPYKDGNDKIYIKNARNYSWKSLGPIGLREIIRDSINTGIADIVDKMGNKNLKHYFLDKFEFGESVGMLNLPGDTNGNITSFYTDSDCKYCYAAKGFGQGFSISPLQMIKAYTALANNGNIIDPQIVEKIKCSDNTIESFTAQGNCVPDKDKFGNKQQRQVVSPTSSQLVTKYMLAAAEEGYLGEGPTKATVPGYRIAIKSGTSQVSRPIIGENGKVSPCDQNCNTARGIYDHTLVGYNTGNSRYIVYLKLAEPRPGVVDNFASSTLSIHFSELMKSTLNYLNIPKEIN